MRNRLTALLAVIGVLASLIYLRHHVRVLADIARTYSTFYPLIDKNPDLLYRFPSPLEVAQQPPQIIHHVALGNGSVANYQEAMDSCKALHPDWDYKLWTDANATEFMDRNYPEIAPHYRGYHQNIQRANVLRYAVLHHHGGVYFDLDVTCLVALDTTPLINLEFVTPGAHPAGVNNAFILARRGHGFLSHLLAAVPAHDMAWGLPLVRLPYIENMLSAGCMFFSNMWMGYVRALLAGRARERVHVLADEEGNLAPHMLRGVVTTPLMHHGGASSWHGWDAAAIVTIGKYYHLLVLMAAAGITTVVVTVMLRCVRSRVRRRRGSGLEVGVLGDEMVYSKPLL